MSQHTVGIVIDKLLTDEDLRIRFVTDRMETLAELCLRGFGLSPNDIDLFCERMLVCGSGPAPRRALRSTGAHVVPSRRAPGMRTRSPYLVTAAGHQRSKGGSHGPANRPNHRAPRPGRHTSPEGMTADRTYDV
jgi:hypothetical protein